MKKVILSMTLVAMFGVNAFGAIYIKYYNKDSQKHTMTVKMDGSTKSVTFNGSTSGAATVQGSGTKGVIQTKCGDVEISDGAKIEIKDGCIKFVN